MQVKALVHELQVRTGLGRLTLGILGVALLTNSLLAGAILTMDRTVRTVFVPPTITKSFWVDGRTLSGDYLEQMGDWVVYQYATVTPSSVDYKAAQLLKYVHPSVHGELAVRFKQGANRLKHENLSHFFTPRDVRISEQTNAVAFIGTLSSWIADKRLPGDPLKAYLVVFDWDGSQTTIKELRETNPRSPFEPLSDQAVESLTNAANQAAVINHLDDQAEPEQAEGSAMPSGGLPASPPPPTAASVTEALEAGQPIKDNK